MKMYMHVCHMYCVEMYMLSVNVYAVCHMHCVEIKQYKSPCQILDTKFFLFWKISVSIVKYLSFRKTQLIHMYTHPTHRTSIKVAYFVEFISLIKTITTLKQKFQNMQLVCTGHVP